MARGFALTGDRARALARIGELWPEGGFVLIGATALMVRLGFETRRTLDLDLVIACGAEDVEARLSSSGEWARDASVRHRWVHADTVRVDVIPATSAVLARGFVEWEGGRRMNLAGMRHALHESDRLPVAPHLEWPVARIDALVLLKMAAYLDRPHDRERDLDDLAQVLEHHPAEDDERLFDPERFQSIPLEVRRPFLLGEDLAAIVDASEREIVQEFLRRLVDESDGSHAQSVMLRVGPAAWRHDAGQLLRRARALRDGFHSRR